MEKQFEDNFSPEKDIKKDRLFNPKTNRDEFIISFESMKNKMNEAVEKAINYPYIFVGADEKIAEELLEYAKNLRESGKDEFEIYRETEKYFQEKIKEQ